MDTEVLASGEGVRLCSPICGHVATDFVVQINHPTARLNDKTKSTNTTVWH